MRVENIFQLTKEAKEFQQMNECSFEEAIEGKVKEYYEEYWGN